MLLSLSIQNIALIDQLQVSFAPGFTALTGETGAGKSIIVGSLEFVLGGRADKDRIAGGASKGQVEALFDVSERPAILSLLCDMAIDIEDGLLPIMREINQNGRSVCRVAGVLVSLAQLRQLTCLLVDLHGQHAHQSLLDQDTHLAFLDAMGPDAHRQQASDVHAAYDKWHAAYRQLQQQQSGQQERARREDMLRFQLQELDGASLVGGEEEELEQQRTMLRNSERIREALDMSYAYLSEGISEEIPSAIDALRIAMHALSSISRYGERFDQAHEQIADVIYTLESITGDISDLRDEAERDPDKLEQIESRLDLLSKLRRKYGATTHDMIAYREQVRQELTASEDTEEALAKLIKQEAALRAELTQQAEALSRARHTLAESCEVRVQQELSELGMQKAHFAVHFTPGTALTPDGLDKIEFMLSANAGEPLRPLSRVASGGELSRIMLAFKCIEAENEGVPVLVFDEVDTGISGRMGQIVADKMQRVAKSRQVLCVTHLPQIAASASEQFLVEKVEVDERTRTMLTLLDAEGRVDAIARMLGEGDTAKAHARVMLERAGDE